nr:hypothetical protein [Bizionia psychrotolerans]
MPIQKKRKRIAQIASFLAIVVMIPAGFTFWNVLQQSNFDTEAKRFVDNELKGLPQYEYIKKNTIPKFNDGDSYIEFNTFGLGEIPETTINLIKSKTSDYPALANTRIIFNQSRTEQYDNMKFMEQLRYRDSIDLISQSQKISFLEDRVKLLSAYEKNTIPFNDVIQEVKINYENLERFSYANEIESDFEKTDTISVFSVKWDREKINTAGIAKEQDKLERWLKVKLKLDTLVVRQIQ